MVSCPSRHTFGSVGAIFLDKTHCLRLLSRKAKSPLSRTSNISDISSVNSSRPLTELQNPLKSLDSKAEKRSVASASKSSSMCRGRNAYATYCSARTITFLPSLPPCKTLFKAVWPPQGSIIQDNSRFPQLSANDCFLFSVAN